jgi:type IV pilus assembly protein PilY1
MIKQAMGLTARRIAAMVFSFGLSVVVGWPIAAAAAAPTVPITQVPMTVVIPAHPQILLALGNSQSMDGDLSGAIYTGSGGLGAGLPELNSSSSPLNYVIPPGFTPPLNPGVAGSAPYTIVTGGLQQDNSASRLNVAKAGITAILTNYLADADFALMDYNTSWPNLYTTWVYQMSPPGGFTFTSTPGPFVPGTNQYVPNPCFGVNTAAGDAVANDCAQLDAFYAGGGVLTQQYMMVAASSDDPLVNDVLYAGGIDPVCTTYAGPNPPSPFPPFYSLWSYETGGIGEGYGAAVGGCWGALWTGPTNAGYVPHSPQVMYEQRGFGYYTWWESSTSGNLVVPMTSSGATPTPASVATALAAFTPYLAPETNESWTSEIKAAATQAPIAGILQGANGFFGTNPPTSNGCTAQRYVVLLTDGLPTLSSSGFNWPPLGTTAAAGYGVSATFDPPPPGGDGALATTNDQALLDVITQLQALNSGPNPIKTYIIGLGAGVDQTVNPQAWSTLTAMAAAGGTGSFFPANSPLQVTADLQIIITKILAATQSTSSAAVNSTGLNTSSVVYQSQFTTSDQNQDWTGNLFAYPIDPTTGVIGGALWSAQTQLDAQNWSAGRMIATWDPVVQAGIPFRWTPGAPASGIAASTVLGQDLETFVPDTSGHDVERFLRGNSAKEIRNGGQFRNRTHKLGDIVNSNPIYIGTPSSSNQSASYLAFAAANASRPGTLYVGADDGMLHAFDATTGNEDFAYIPSGVYANLIQLVNPYYNAVHQFYVNGSPQAFDVQFASDNSWHTVLVSGEAQGGNSVFALDVSNPANITSESLLASAVLWDFTDPDMGLTFSTPTIANTADGWQVFVGNGYNSAQQKPFLYAINPQYGTITRKIDLCAAVPTACNLAASNGLSTVIAINSSGVLAANANLVYAGDMQGNLWRVDISNANPVNWTVSVLFQATDALGNPQPIETSPVATLNPQYPQTMGTMVFFATGQFLGTPDLLNTNVQTIYGVYDPPAGYATPLTRGSLVGQSITAAALNGATVAISSNTSVTIPAQKGWYLDLTFYQDIAAPSGVVLAGERAVSDPRLESGGALVLTTYAPNSIECDGGGAAFLYILNYANGGAFPTPQFAVNHTGGINGTDTTAGGNPVGEYLGPQFATGATIRPNPLGNMKLITEANGAILPVQEKGNTKSRTAWWEVRQ